MSEKNDTVVTERDVFLYIRSNPMRTRDEISRELAIGPWWASHRIGKLVRDGVILEIGSGKNRKFKVSSEFETVEPVFSPESGHRKASKYKPVIDVYKKMLAGEELNKIDATDDVKAQIRLYEKHKSLSAWQLFEKFGMPAGLTTELHVLAKAQRKKSLIQSYKR